MIYALAAYSITVGVLALYCILLQHRGRVYALPQSSATEAGLISRSDSDLSSDLSSDPNSDLSSGLRSGFNVGAALLSPVWLWQHGARAAGAGLFVLCVALIPLFDREMWIPFLFVGMVPLAAGTALGFVGNRIAKAHRGAESPEAFSASQLPWAIAGVVLFSVVLPWAWYFLYAAV